MNVQRRAWPVAIALSLAVHLVLLLVVALITHQVLRATAAPVRASPPPGHRGPVFRVSVRPSGTRGGGPAAEPRSPAAVAGHPRPRSLGGAKAPAPAPGEVPLAGADEDGGGGEPAAGSGETAEGAGAQGAAGVSGTTGPVAPPDRSDLAPLVHARLEAAAVRCYPAAAKRFRQSGTATIVFCVGGDGTGSAPQVQESSGVALLDSATACVVERAAPFPAEAAGQCFTVPVRFGR